MSDKRYGVKGKNRCTGTRHGRQGQSMTEPQEHPGRQWGKNWQEQSEEAPEWRKRKSSDTRIVIPGRQDRGSFWRAHGNMGGAWHTLQ